MKLNEFQYWLDAMQWWFDATDEHEKATGHNIHHQVGCDECTSLNDRYNKLQSNGPPKPFIIAVSIVAMIAHPITAFKVAKEKFGKNKHNISREGSK